MTGGGGGDGGGPLLVLATPNATEASARLPPAPGDYLLVWWLTGSQPPVHVGRLGAIRFAPGTWAYAGSAHGPGGLRARLSRHLTPDKPLHWHVDHVAAALAPPSVIAIPGPGKRSGRPVPAGGHMRRLECDIVRCLLRTVGFLSPIAGFGSSDCRDGCPAHLLHTSREVRLAELRAAIEQLIGSRTAPRVDRRAGQP